jgi:hypothetical protein
MAFFLWFQNNSSHFPRQVSSTCYVNAISNCVAGWHKRTVAHCPLCVSWRAYTQYTSVTEQMTNKLTPDRTPLLAILHQHLALGVSQNSWSRLIRPTKGKKFLRRVLSSSIWRECFSIYLFTFYSYFGLLNTAFSGSHYIWQNDGTVSDNKCGRKRS